MDLVQLLYFVRVAELGSFTRAAAALGVAQPALSRQVRLLEVELRHTLLRRTGRGAVTTAAGALLLEHGRGILHQVDRARDELAQMRGGLAGRVAIGLPPSVARALTVRLSRAFQAQLPDARLAVSEGLSTSLLESLVAGRLDVAVLYNAAVTPDVEITPLGREELLLVQPAAAPPGAHADSADGTAPTAHATLAELSQLPLVIPSRPNAIRMHVEGALAQAGLSPTVAMEVDGIPSILELVAGGAGCAVLSRQTVLSAQRPEAFRLRRIQAEGGAGLQIALFTAVSARRPATRTQLALLELLRTLVAEEAAARQKLQF
ncbi:LysR substrate-binding domain-containing protein [Ottowia oryzae]